MSFGRGQRHELDDEDAAVLVKQIRDIIKVEWEREFGVVEKVAKSSHEPTETSFKSTELRMAAKL